MSYDDSTHRLFIGERSPGKLVVLDSNSGKVVATATGAAMIDDMGFDAKDKLVFFAGTEFMDIFRERDADHIEQIGHVPTAFRAKTGLYVPELNRYYLGVPHHETKSAELRIYQVEP